MVEYALLTAGSAARVMYGQVTSIAGSVNDSVNWTLVGAGLLLLLTLRLLFTPRV